MDANTTYSGAFIGSIDNLINSLKLEEIKPKGGQNLGWDEVKQKFVVSAPGYLASSYLGSAIWGSAVQSPGSLAAKITELNTQYTSIFEDLISKAESGLLKPNEMPLIREKLIQLKQAILTFNVGLSSLLPRGTSAAADDSNSLKVADQMFTKQLEEEIEKLSKLILNQYVVYLSPDGEMEVNPDGFDLSACDFLKNQCFESLKKANIGGKNKRNEVIFDQLVLTVSDSDFLKVQFKQGRLTELDFSKLLTAIEILNKATPGESYDGLLEMCCAYINTKPGPLSSEETEQLYKLLNENSEIKEKFFNGLVATPWNIPDIILLIDKSSSNQLVEICRDFMNTTTYSITDYDLKLLTDFLNKNPTIKEEFFKKLIPTKENVSMLIQLLEGSPDGSLLEKCLKFLNQSKIGFEGSDIFINRLIKIMEQSEAISNSFMEEMGSKIANLNSTETGYIGILINVMNQNGDTKKVIIDKLQITNNNFIGALQLLSGSPSEELLDKCYAFANMKLSEGNDNYINILKRNSSIQDLLASPNEKLLTQDKRAGLIKVLINRDPNFKKRFLPKLEEFFDRNKTNIRNKNDEGVDLKGLVENLNTWINITKGADLTLENYNIMKSFDSLIDRFLNSQFNSFLQENATTAEYASKLKEAK